MEWILGIVSGDVGGFLASKLGITGMVLWGLLIILKHFDAAEREALFDACRQFKTLVTNIPKRWNSERGRVGIAIANLRAEGYYDAAQVKAAKEALKAAVRVFAGVIEDALNLIIDIAAVVLPGILGAYNQVMKRKNGDKNSKKLNGV